MVQLLVVVAAVVLDAPLALVATVVVIAALDAAGFLLGLSHLTMLMLMRLFMWLLLRVFLLLLLNLMSAMIRV